MRALSLYEPWASLIAHGIKTVETRPRSTAGAYRGPVAIQASKHWTQAERAAWVDFSRLFGEVRFPSGSIPGRGQPGTLGKVVAVAQIVHVWQFAGDELLTGRITRDEVLCGDTAPDGSTAWSARRARRDVRQVIFAPAASRHSEKPEAMQDRIEALWPWVDPSERLELFARRRRPNWACWGGQCPEPDLVFGDPPGAWWPLAPRAEAVAQPPPVPMFTEGA